MDPAAARELTARTFVAAGRMISEQDAPIDELIRTLATPGGITEAGLNTLAAELRHAEEEASAAGAGAESARAQAAASGSYLAGGIT